MPSKKVDSNLVTSDEVAKGMKMSSFNAVPARTKYRYKHEIHSALAVNFPKEEDNIKWSEGIMNKLGAEGKRVIQIYRLEDGVISDEDGKTVLTKWNYAFLVEEVY